MKQSGRSERRACQLAGISRSVYRYQPIPKHEEPMRARLRELARERPRFGSPRLTVLLRREFGLVNHKRVERLYREEGLQLPRRRKKRRRGVQRVPLESPAHPNERWSMDFMSDSLYNGRRFRVLSVLDDFSRQCLALEVDTSLSGERVTRVLDQLIDAHGRPSVLVMDNGPEFTSRAMLRWAQDQEVALHYIDPGKPVQNAFVESFHSRVRDECSRVRDECLQTQWFASLGEARHQIEAWRRDYNRVRPHSSLDYQPPITFLCAWKQAQAEPLDSQSQWT
jgi:putative transposase